MRGTRPPYPCKTPSLSLLGKKITKTDHKGHKIIKNMPYHTFQKHRPHTPGGSNGNTKKYDARSAGHELGPLSCDIFQLEPSSASGFTGALANCRWYNLQVHPRLSKTNAVTHCRTHSICEYAEKQCCIPCYHVLFYDAKMMGFFGLFLLMSRSQRESAI